MCAWTFIYVFVLVCEGVENMGIFLLYCAVRA